MASFFSDQSLPAPAIGIAAALISRGPGRTQIVRIGTAEATSRSGKFILGQRPFTAVQIASSADRTTRGAYPPEARVSGWLSGRARPGAGGAAGTEGKLLGRGVGCSTASPMPDKLSPWAKGISWYHRCGGRIIDVAGRVMGVRAQTDASHSATIAALRKDLLTVTPLLGRVQ
jgi:hypothetical protein